MRPIRAATVAELNVRAVFDAALVGRQLDVMHIDPAEDFSGVSRSARDERECW